MHDSVMRHLLVMTSNDRLNCHHMQKKVATEGMYQEYIAKTVAQQVFAQNKKTSN
jgi:thioredoxin-related protein